MKPSIENEKTENELTEDEQLEIYAKLIIDIYLNSEYENEKI